MKGKIEKRLRSNEEKIRQHRERQIRAKVLSDSGYSVEQISETLGVTPAAVRNYLKRGEENE